VDPLPTSDPATLVAATPGGAVCYTDEGPPDAPALLCLHGVPGSVRDFRYLAPQLFDGVRVIRIDLPGFGCSAVQPEPLDSLSARGRVALAIADTLGIGRFALAGHSMGGGAALAAAAFAPDRVGQLILLASMGATRHRGFHPGPRVFGALALLIRLPLLGRLLMPLARSAYRSRRLPGADAMSASDFALQFRALAAADFRLVGTLAAGRLPPALVAFARDDALIEPAVSEDLVTRLSRPRVVRFESGGHNIQKTRAPELGLEIASFLAA
jgi:pimeloyl-ACP methyl ester carboxylesterase